MDVQLFLKINTINYLEGFIKSFQATETIMTFKELTVSSNKFLVGIFTFWTNELTLANLRTKKNRNAFFLHQKNLYHVHLKLPIFNSLLQNSTFRAALFQFFFSSTPVYALFLTAVSVRCLAIKLRHVKNQKLILLRLNAVQQEQPLENIIRLAGKYVFTSGAVGITDK